MTDIEDAEQTPGADETGALEGVVTKKVRATETAYRDMLRDAAVAIIMGDTAGRVVFANPAAERAFGYGAGEMLGLEAGSLVSEAVRTELALKRGESPFGTHPNPVVLEGPISARRKDGSEFPVALSIGSVHLEGGPVVAAFVLDLSGRLAAERQIIEYRQRLQRMAFDAAVAEKRERRRMAVALHDRIGQSLIVAQMKLAACRDLVTGPARARLEDALEVISATVADTRSLTFELAPPLLYDLGLRAALVWLAGDLRKRYDLEVELVDDNEEKPLDDATAALVFRAARELLINVFKHARTRRARVTLGRDAASLWLKVEDEGAGFDAALVNHRRAGNAFGLFSVQEQLTHLGGEVNIESAPGAGTCVTLRVPLRREETKPV